MQAVCYTTTVMITNRKLHEVHPVVTSFWIGLSTILTYVVAMLVFEAPTVPTGLLCRTLMIVLSLTAGVSPLLQFVAMVLLDPLVLTPMLSLLTVIFADHNTLSCKTLVQETGMHWQQLEQLLSP